MARVTAEANETGAEVLALDLMRLDAMLMSVWSRVLAGDPQACQIGLRVLERRARMLGYDAPSKVAPTSPDGSEPWGTVTLSEDEYREVRAEVERLLSEAVGR